MSSTETQSILAELQKAQKAHLAQNARVNELSAEIDRLRPLEREAGYARRERDEARNKQLAAEQNAAASQRVAVEAKQEASELRAELARVRGKANALLNVPDELRELLTEIADEEGAQS
jgi:multidrug resistance efflux pump